jgi:CsoR family transcriptional regulator, copper-sensing transcriptional repressor
MAYRPKDTQERILHRLKIARGHLDKVIKMVDSNDYCIDILTQSQAVQSAIKQTDALLLENHLKTCVVDHIQQGQTEGTVQEIMKVFKKS